MLKEIKRCWKSLQLRRECAAYIRHNGLTVVLEALWNLNHIARYDHGGKSEVIYSLKTAVIRKLYQMYPHPVEVHYQHRECWTCYGTGVYYTGAKCLRCGGTGVYRRIELYTFCFEINGRKYHWHQPQNLVNYPVVKLESTEPYRRSNVHRYTALSGKEIDLYMMIVYCWLQMEGVKVPVIIPTFRRLAKTTWAKAKPRIFGRSNLAKGA